MNRDELNTNPSADGKIPGDGGLSGSASGDPAGAALGGLSDLGLDPASSDGSGEFDLAPDDSAPLIEPGLNPDGSGNLADPDFSPGVSGGSAGSASGDPAGAALGDLVAPDSPPTGAGDSVDRSSDDLADPDSGNLADTALGDPVGSVLSDPAGIALGGLPDLGLDPASSDGSGEFDLAPDGSASLIEPGLNPTGSGNLADHGLSPAGAGDLADRSSDDLADSALDDLADPGSGGPDSADPDPGTPEFDWEGADARAAGPSVGNGAGKSGSRSYRSEIFAWVDSVVFSVITVILLFTFAFRVVGIKGQSMENTIFEGDKVMISGMFYSPRPGDIVVVSRDHANTPSGPEYGTEPIIKRVIAVAGQTVDIDFENGIVYVDGKALREPYTKTLTTRRDDVSFPLTVEEGHIFVLGDNRAVSRDSRSSDIGQVDERYVLGRVVLRVGPMSRFGKVA